MDTEPRITLWSRLSNFNTATKQKKTTLTEVENAAVFPAVKWVELAAEGRLNQGEKKSDH